MTQISRALPLAGAALASIAVWAFVLSRLDLFTSSDVRAWRRLAALRGYATPMGRLERAAARVPLVRRVQEELDLHRLLAIAGWSETPPGFLLRTVLVALVATALVLVLLTISLAKTGSWALPPFGAPLAGAFVWLLQVLMLRLRVESCRDRAGQALGDMMTLVAIMTDGRGLQVEDAVRILSRCAHHRSLEEIVDLRGWRRLIRESPHTTIELFRAIAAEYRIPVFAVVADAAANANLGFSERETYSRVASSVYAGRLAEARFRAARAKTLVTLPVAGMLIPLLVLIGAPIFAVISGSLR